MRLRWPSHVICFGGPLDGQEIPLSGKYTVTLSRPSYRYEYFRVDRTRIIAVYAGIEPNV